MPQDGPNKSSAPLLVAAQMRELEAQIKTCPLCKLSRTRTNAVPGEGSYRAEVMFIGEGPGYHEDRQGRPFVGPAGQFLNELLGIAGLSRESAYITNVVKCRPPNNRDPEPDEIAACAPYLERQIALVNPRIIVTLGRYSMAKFFPGERISQIHGTARVVDGRLCVAMYHPAAGLHQASLADVIRADFRKLPIFIEQARELLSPALLASPQVDEASVGEPEPPAVSEQLTVPAPHLVQEQSVQYNTEDIPPTLAEPAEETSAEPVAEPSVTVKPKKLARKKEEYKQLSFFDIQ